MTFQDRKITGKFWDKSKEKREKLHDRDVIKANDPKAVIEQDAEEIRKEEEDKENREDL